MSSDNSSDDLENEKYRFHILVFGKNQSGKTTVTNNLTASKLPTHDDAHMVRFPPCSVRYERDGKDYVFHDMPADTSENPRLLISDMLSMLKKLERINLALYVRKCEPMDEMDVKILKKFAIPLLKNVPVVCVNTCADNCLDPGDWWKTNGAMLKSMSPLKFNDGVSVSFRDLRPSQQTQNQNIQQRMSATFKQNSTRSKSSLWTVIEKSKAQKAINVYEQPVSEAIESFFKLINQPSFETYYLTLPAHRNKAQAILIDEFSSLGLKDREAKETSTTISKFSGLL